MVVDSKVAVIGFPMVAGKGNVGAIILRRRAAVEGVESVFNAMCKDAESTLLFEGSETRTIDEMAQIRQRVRILIRSTASL